MPTDLFPFVDFEITVCGIEELPQHSERRVTHILTLLDPGWPTPSFEGYGTHRRLDLRFHDVIETTPEWRAPEAEDVAQLLAFGRDVPAGESHLLVHCHMGISRSSAAMLLTLMQARPDRTADEALAEVVRIRPYAWPNLRILEIGGAMLGRKDELIDAAYRRDGFGLSKKPSLGDAMIKLGRLREVEAGRARVTPDSAARS